MLYLYLVISFIFGLAIGSFLNCLIYRLYHKKSLWGRSFCPQCGHRISWYDNIPLISFIVLRARCRHCRQKISWQYPLIELATGFFFIAGFLNTLNQFTIYNLQFIIFLIRNWLAIATFIFIFVYDLKYLIIEDVIILPVAAIIFILNIILGQPILWLLLAITLAAGFFLGQYLLTRGKAIGLGDFRIGILMGALLGWPQILCAIFLAYIIGAPVCLLLLSFRLKKMSSLVPLGPFLSIGTLITLFFGQQILDWYLRF